MGNFSRRDFGGRGASGGFDRGGYRPMCKAVCSNCGKECEVPFKPTNGKPVYCRDCFGEMKGKRQDFPRPERVDFRTPSIDQSKGQLDSINAKLDKILKLLEPKIAAVTVPAEVQKAVGVKKAAKKSAAIENRSRFAKIVV